MSIVSINYKLLGEPKSSLAQFDTVLEGVRFVNSLDTTKIDYVSLTDGFGHQVIGEVQINKVYERHSDLWAGEKYCLHPETGSGHGGGQVCKTCKAWFCY